MTHQPDAASTPAHRRSDTGCPPMSLSRRSFIAATTAVAGAALSRSLAANFPFLQPDDFPIPADKGFSPEWLASLTARGEPSVYRFKRDASGAEQIDELKYIGMPVGGICTGQLYLGGDGKLWHWDIFNQPAPPDWRDTNGPHYAKPPTQASPIEHGIAISIFDGAPRRLDRTGFSSIEFRGTYPIGRVDYSHPDVPARISLEAFSPFIPLDEDDSGLPITILNYTVTNTTSIPIKVQMGAWLENPVCKWSGKPGAGIRRTRWNRSGEAAVILECTATEPPDSAKRKRPERPDISFENWEKGTYSGWTATGTAFGDKPRKLTDIAAYQGDLNALGDWTVNTHETRHGEDVGKADTYLGTLSSRAFKIDRNYISFRIGGGAHAGKTCVNLLINGAVVRTAAGQNNNRMRIENWDVRELAGKEASIQIVDDHAGGWGQIGCDDIIFCDEPHEDPYILREAGDYGSIVLAALKPASDGGGSAALNGPDFPKASLASGNAELAAPFDTAPMVGSVTHGSVSIRPHESRTFTFVIAWHFATPWRDSLSYLTDFKKLRRSYAARFKDARDALEYTVKNLDRLTTTTRAWRDTWYDSTLPHWFLDRTFSSATTAATSTCYRFDTPRGTRFYAWEGTYACPGTCTHVWNYAQTLARIFPALERNVREMVDFDMEFEKDTGLIYYRGEAARHLAIDGQCGTIIRAYREHTMCSDDRFLRKVWPNVKKAIEFVLARDPDQDGILDGEQYNTLDTSWYGAISWISSLYLAMLRAGAAMATEMGETNFAARCTQIADRGSKNLTERLFNDEYFIHVTDPKRPDTNSIGNGCHDDMILGQFHAHQMNLPRVVPLEQSQTALRSLYKYNLAPDIGPYRTFAEKTVKGGRWYAMPGEGGLIVCTWPKGGSESATGKSGDAWAAMYFNECWTGFEHHVAAHMIAEGLLDEGLAIERLVHDRHHAARRNPYNEVEASSHYARAMAAYGAFLAACGYAHHGPSGFLAFDPKLSPENFRAAFTCATGWGSFAQTRTDKSQTALIESKWGKIKIASLRLGVPRNVTISKPTAAGPSGPAFIADTVRTADAITLRFTTPVELAPSQKLDISLNW